jgi:hypothetical protein
MRKTLSILSLAILAACTSQGPTTPDLPTSEAPAPVAAPATPAPSTPTVVPPPDEGRGVTVTFGNNASWDVHNNNGQASEFWAYWTDFDNQDLARGVKHAIIQDGDHFIESFNRGCVQLDITQEQTVVGGSGGRAIAAAYYDNNGKKVSRISDEIRKACNAKPCVEPRETPTTPGAYSWSDAILEGQCEQESFPVGIDAVANCHQTGTQKWAIDYTCQADGERVADLCRNVACPIVDVCPNLEGDQPTLPEGYHFGEDDNGRTICIEDEEPPVEGFCLYALTGNPDGRPATCAAHGGVFVEHDQGEGHCQLPWPGIDLQGFNLTDGQSVDGCLPIHGPVN